MERITRSRTGLTTSAARRSTILLFAIALFLIAWPPGAGAATIELQVGWNPHPDWASANQAERAVNVHIYCANLTAGEQVGDPAVGTTPPDVVVFKFQRQANGGDVMECKLKAERDGQFSVFTSGVQGVVPFGIPDPPTGLSVDVDAQ